MSTLANRQTIIVGIDGSPTSLAAARWAAHLADRLHAPMLLMQTIIDPTTAYYYGGPLLPVYPNATEELNKEAEVVLEHARDQIIEQYPSLDVATTVHSGAPAVVLVELSDQARMVVVGSQGKGAAGPSLLGSTTLRVADHAHSPVVVWRGDPELPLTSEAPILVGVDGSEQGERAVAQAFELASMLGVPLVTLHAWTDDEQRASALLSECVAGFTDNYPDVEVQQIVQDGNPAKALLQWSKTAQLVVVASRVRSGVIATLLGSTSQNLLHQATAPLLICRGR